MSRESETPAQRFLDRKVIKVSGESQSAVQDQIALEEPLEIQLTHGPDRKRTTVAITMRTPGHDLELAAGFLIGEGLIDDLRQVESVHACGPRYGIGNWHNSVRVVLRAEVSIDLKRLERNFYMTSSCGVCGKTSLEALKLDSFPPLSSAWQMESAVVCDLPARLRKSQAAFERTGGLHAAGLFTSDGEAFCVREDVGRHNAVDKVIGSRFLAGHAHLANHILVVSGRASFELMQKALASRIAMLVAVGAPSSLAVELANESGATLVGFTKAGGFNIYSGEHRISFSDAKPSQVPLQKILS